jgi:hypothetical protein
MPDALPPVTLAPTFEELKQKRMWLCGRKFGPNGEKTSGEPLNARTGEPGAAATNPADHDTFQVAANTAQRLGLHVGVALGPIEGTPWALVGIDIDNAREGEQLKPFADKMIKACDGMVPERSRSRRGLHFYAVALKSVIAEVDVDWEHKKLKRQGMGLEVYFEDRYFIATGRLSDDDTTS